MVPGHELSGVIAGIGEGVSGWHIGDRVVALAYDPCRKCSPCRLGTYQLCENKFWIGITTYPGAYANYVKVRPGMLLPIPDQVSDRAAAVAETLSVALHAVRTANFTLGERAVVIGAGPVGLLVTQCLRLAGARSIGVVEISSRRRELAARLGANKVFQPGEGHWIGEVIASLGSEPDFVFECAGAPQTLQNAADLIKPGGKIVLVSVSMEPVSIHPLAWGRKEAELKSSTAYCDEFPLALEFIAEGRIDVESLISEVIPLKNIDQTLKALRKPNNQIKVLVAPHMDDA